MLEKSLAHPNALIREKAIESAGRFGDARTIASLQTAVRDENSRIRAAAAQAFVNAMARRDDSIGKALAEIISSGSDNELRRFLISESSPSEIERVVDGSPALRKAADAVLNQRNGWLTTQAAADALPTIESCVRSSDPQIALAAQVWTEKLRRAQVRRTMLESGVASMLTLTAALRCSNTVMRRAAAAALGQSTDGRAIPALVDALRDKDETVRRTAAVALGNLNWGATKEQELASQLIALGRWPEMVAIGANAVDALLHAAAHSRPATQVAAIEALAETRSVRAMMPLQEMLNSPTADIRRAAARALKILEWVPTTDAQAIVHAIELEDWNSAASYGASATAALLAELKKSVGDNSRTEAISSALNLLRDATAAQALLKASHDGEVAGAAAKALEQLLDECGADFSTESLEEILSLNNLVQFKFEVNAQYGQPMRTGIDLVDLNSLQEKAAIELARRLVPQTAEAA
jgi:HEAT repeat protein